MAKARRGKTAEGVRAWRAGGPEIVTSRVAGRRDRVAVRPRLVSARTAALSTPTEPAFLRTAGYAIRIGLALPCTTGRTGWTRLTSVWTVAFCHREQFSHSAFDHLGVACAARRDMNDSLPHPGGAAWRPFDQDQEASGQLCCPDAQCHVTVRLPSGRDDSHAAHDDYGVRFHDGNAVSSEWQRPSDPPATRTSERLEPRAPSITRLAVWRAGGGQSNLHPSDPFPLAPCRVAPRWVFTRNDSGLCLAEQLP
jgi:hypothetical protein